MGIDRDAILRIKKRIESKKNLPNTEEATKQWLVMPVLVALGYDPYSEDVIPEYTLDVGIKRGEKIDYALQVDGEITAIIECKSIGVTLSNKHVGQLFRYFTTCEARIAILTNGNEYWFFTDSEKENIMDLKPYYKITMSNIKVGDLDRLEMYSKDKIREADIPKPTFVNYEKLLDECRKFIYGIRRNDIPTWLIDTLIDISGIEAESINKSDIANYIQDEIRYQFRGYTGNKPGKQKKRFRIITVNDQRMTEDGRRVSNIKLNHEYVYNDYTDGDWMFHTLEYAIILGVKYNDISARELLVYTLKELIEQGKVNPNRMIEHESFRGVFRIAKGKGELKDNPYYFDKYNIHMRTKFGIDKIVVFIERMLRYAGVEDSEIIVSFED